MLPAPIALDEVFADPDALVAFSVAGAMGAAALFSDSHWCNALGVDDVEALADAVLDLIVHRHRITALPSPEALPRSGTRSKAK